MNKGKSINLYLVSDATGETVLAISNAVIAQFADITVHKYLWPMVRSKMQVDKLLDDISKLPGIVLYTIVDHELRSYMKAGCQKLNVVCISAITHVIQEFAKCIDSPIKRSIPGWQHVDLDAEYFRKIDAINFSILHDDGQNTHDIETAEIVLIGVSRTSKTPTTLYLAQRGLKTANIPYIKGITVNVDLEKLKQCFIVGLVITPERLRLLRTNRLLSVSNKININDYTDTGMIADEIRESRHFFQQNHWPIIDVSGKAIEETAAEVLSMYYEKIGKHSTEY